MIKKFLKRFIYSDYFPVFAYHLIRLYSATFRLKLVHENNLFALLNSGKTVLLGVWHQQFFSLIRHFKSYTASYNPGLMISRSRDGKLIAGVAQRTGWYTARGSSSKGGRAALENMISHLKEHRLGAHLLDGPTGPRGIVKPGVIKMARESGALIMPVYVQSDTAWYFNSWDRFMLPKPFAEVRIIFGEPLEFPNEEDSAQFELQRKHLESQMLPYLMYRLVPE